MLKYGNPQRLQRVDTLTVFRRDLIDRVYDADARLRSGVEQWR